MTAVSGEDSGTETPMPQFRSLDEATEGKRRSSEGERIRRKIVKETAGAEGFDWESEDGGGARVGSMRSLRPILFGGAVVLILMVGLATYILLDQDRQVTFTAAGETGPGGDGGRERQKMFQLPVREETLDPVDESEIANLETEMSKLEDAVKEFLGATTVEEILAVTGRDPVLEQKIRSHYRTHQLSPVTPKSLAPDGRILRNRGLWAIDVILPDHSAKPIAAKRLDGRYVIDWESWVGYSEVPWAEVGKVRPTEPVLFRVLCSPVAYYNFGFTDDRKWRSYRLQSPDRKHTLYGYVERLSVQESMLTRTGVAPDKMLAYVLRIRFSDECGPDQVIIEEVVESGWVTAGSHESSAPTRLFE